MERKGSTDEETPTKKDLRGRDRDDRGRLLCRFSGCSKGYTSPFNLKTHEDQEHMGGPRFGCSECDKSYAQKFNLKVHVQQKHPELTAEEVNDILDKSDMVKANDELDLTEVEDLANGNDSAVNSRNDIFNDDDRAIREMLKDKQGIPKLGKDRASNVDSVEKALGIKSDENRNRVKEPKERSESSTEDPANGQEDAITDFPDSGDRFVCRECSLVFESSGLLRSHRREKHSCFKCDKCGDGFTSAWSLGRHIKQQHMQDGHGDEDESKSRPMEITTKRDHSKRKSEGKAEALDDFITSEEGEKKSRIKKEVHEHENDKEIANLPNGHIMCHPCGRAFDSLPLLRNHRIKEHSDYKCTECKNSYTFKQALVRHMKMSHRQDESLDDEEGGSFKVKEEIHEDEDENDDNLSDSGELFVCRTCAQEFPSLSLLRHHSSKEHRVFNCSDCRRSYTNKANLKRHAHTAHSHGAQDNDNSVGEEEEDGSLEAGAAKRSLDVVAKNAGSLPIDKQRITSLTKEAQVRSLPNQGVVRRKDRYGALHNSFAGDEVVEGSSRRSSTSNLDSRRTESFTREGDSKRKMSDIDRSSEVSESDMSGRSQVVKRRKVITLLQAPGSNHGPPNNRRSDPLQQRRDRSGKRRTMSVAINALFDQQFNGDGGLDQLIDDLIGKCYDKMRRITEKERELKQLKNSKALVESRLRTALLQKKVDDEDSDAEDIEREVDAILAVLKEGDIEAVKERIFGARRE